MDGEPIQPNMGSDQRTNGALVGSAVIVILLILGGIYLARKIMEERALPENSNLSVVLDKNI